LQLLVAVGLWCPMACNTARVAPRPCGPELPCPAEDTCVRGWCVLTSLAPDVPDAGVRDAAVAFATPFRLQASGLSAGAHEGVTVKRRLRARLVPVSAPPTRTSTTGRLTGAFLGGR